jgi:two-component system NtrC family response regulator
MEKLLIVDDTEEIKTQLKWGMGSDYTVFLAGNCAKALALFRKQKPKVVTLDLGLPPDEEGTTEGFRCLETIVKESPDTKVIVITGNDQRQTALRAIQSGAYDFYQKPIDLKELKVIVQRAFHLSNLERENRALHLELGEKAGETGGMFGQCSAMQEVFATIRKIASSEAAVLIIGESGTGKELVARSIHAKSLRKDHPFVPINCGAIPENLLESELFGHEKGAFTGAQSQVQGKFEFAHQGTLFLDEIAELPLNLQVKLLRFLQDKTIQRVGGREDISVNARIIAATNIDIAKALQDGKFREDLYYRIGVITITLPPLRERGDDVVVLSNLFLGRFSREAGKNLKGFAHEALGMLRSHTWPGNVRELENMVHRAVIMCEGAFVKPEDLGFAEKPAEQVVKMDALTLKEVRDRAERERVLSAMDRYQGNIAKTAEELGISRPTLYDLLKKHRISHS